MKQKILIRYNGLNLFRAPGGIALIPGVNEVDADAMEEAAKHPLVQYRFENRIIEYVGPASKPGAVVSTSTRDMKVGEAVALIKETVDANLLARWQEEDDRKGVQDAIADQFDAIKLDQPKENE